MPCVWKLPVNAKITLVVLCRPLTFLVAFSYSLLALATSTFYSLSGLEPLECRCPTADKSPRTRPRPVPITSVPPSPTNPKPLTPLETFSSFVTSFRPHPRPPPVARRGSHNKNLPYPTHELDQVEEEEDGEEMDFDREGIPGLTPDGSEGDDTSSVDTLDDIHVDVAAPSKKARSKGLMMLSNLRWKKNSSPEEASQVRSRSSSSADSAKSTSSTTSPNSEHPPILPSKSLLKTNPARPRSATSASTTTRSVRFTGRRQTSLDSVSSTESLEGPVLKSRKPLAITTSSQPHSLLTKTSFRSLSPLTRSPVTTPEPSPPSSPRLASCPFSKHITTRLQRSHSLDSPNSSSSRGRRTRSVSPLPELAPRLRRGVSASDKMGLDSSGSSGLSLDDLL